MGYSVGDRVVQAQYGTGTITSSDEHHTVIDFDEHGIKTFSTPLVRLQRSETAAPNRPRRRSSRAKTATPKATKTAASKASASKR
ncbi:MAG: hypothetical protein FJW23_17530 [Acidimicrobiia bacterium]|nr:hypothetical protein [Acidimicrobiia bacterium]